MAEKCRIENLNKKNEKAIDFIVGLPLLLLLVFKEEGASGECKYFSIKKSHKTR